MIKLFGSLARKLKKHYPDVDPKNIPIQCKSAAECIRTLNANFPGFKTWIKRKGYYKVIAGSDVNEDNKSLSKDELVLNIENTDWCFCPIAAGAGGKGGILQIVLGAVLIIVGVIVGYNPYYPNPVLGNFMIAAGISMMLGGVIQMLTPVPPMPKPKGSEDTPSYLFNGALNADEPGLTVPCAYGHTWTGSIVTSFGISVEDL